MSPDYEPEACLVNYYEDGAKMGQHQDRDEEVFDAARAVCFSRQRLPVQGRGHKAGWQDVLTQAGKR